MDRRTLLAAAGAGLIAPGALAGQRRAPDARFPQGFLWGTATAGHQIEGNNVNSDVWLLENVKPTLFTERSGDAVNSFEMWPVDLDLVKALGLNTYRFSLEWARIEPEPGLFSIVMLDHYKAIVEGCRARGLTPMVTYNHLAVPRWFAARGGWTADDAADLFARYCDRATRHLGAAIGYATTLNEPNLIEVLSTTLPPQVLAGTRPMLAAAAKATGTTRFVATGSANPEDLPALARNQIAAHKAGRAAIKAVRGDLPVGVSIAVVDDQAVGRGSIRDSIRARLYGPWFDAVRGDDFLGVQNYERNRWDAKGRLPVPAGAPVNYSGAEVYAPSLANAVRYAHQATGLPIIVTEHGVGTDDDAVRAAFIPAALKELKATIDDGVPVKGYVHWTLLDNFEWVFGYRVHFGLHSVDRTTFQRTAKPSAGVYGAIARRNAV